MSDDPLFDSLSALERPPPPPALDQRTQRAAEQYHGKGYLRWLGLALGLLLLALCALYLIVLIGRASALY